MLDRREKHTKTKAKKEKDDFCIAFENKKNK